MWGLEREEGLRKTSWRRRPLSRDLPFRGLIVGTVRASLLGDSSELQSVLKCMRSFQNQAFAFNPTSSTC